VDARTFPGICKRAQAEIVLLRNVTVAPIPADLTAQGVLGMAKATLHAQLSNIKK
jgi:hypothetical protein